MTFAGFASGTLGPKLIAAGPLVVASSTSTAFTIVSALTGTTGTGTATGSNPPVPFSVKFWSELASGYEYQYSTTTGVLFVLQSGSATPAGTIAIPVDTNVGTTGPVYADTVANHFSTTGSATSITNATFTGSASTAAALAPLSAAAYPAGVLNDVIKYEAKFVRE